MVRNQHCRRRNTPIGQDFQDVLKRCKRFYTFGYGEDITHDPFVVAQCGESFYGRSKTDNDKSYYYWNGKKWEKKEEELIINLTPHDINIVDRDGKLIHKFETSGKVARLEVSTGRLGKIYDIPLSSTIYGEIKGLPDYSEGTYYIVSQLIKNSPEGKKRTDLLVPAEMLRDERHQIIGCQSLGM